MARHDCKQTYRKYRGDEFVGDFYNYICFHCGGCYVCRHKFVYFDDAEKWMKKCKDGKWRDIILDGRVQA